MFDTFTQKFPRDYTAAYTNIRTISCSPPLKILSIKRTTHSDISVKMQRIILLFTKIKIFHKNSYSPDPRCAVPLGARIQSKFM